ncbi:TRAM domain-containing protein [Haloarchaeobius amylolyticus]|uniref:TRAM domain-containing protein n=1 Tax=Haloarchaeobius amylolyticus TaxID=1198296 RepID=UPI002270E112|nr:TRAM domain-containing protein [Haloarchaeobius amylolyticus]
MTNVPDSLELLFTGRLQRSDDTYLIEVPETEVDYGSLVVGNRYRVALIEHTSNSPVEKENTSPDSREQYGNHTRQTGPPVSEGEVREVTIETTGQQGDGIAKVERGFVVIVPDARPGDEPVVMIEKVRENVAFASVQR